MAIRCSACRGTKKYIALGNLLKDCKVCQGIGFVKEEDVPTINKKEVSSNDGKTNGKAERKTD